MFRSIVRHARRRIRTEQPDEVILEPTKEYYQRKLRSDVQKMEFPNGELGSNASKSPVEELSATIKGEKRTYKDEIKRIHEFHKKVRLLRSRNTVTLPRKHWMVIQNGPPLQMADLSNKAASIFDEDDGKVEQLLEKITQGRDKFDPLDETKPYWKRASPNRKIEWQLPERPPNMVPFSPDVNVMQRVTLDEYNVAEEMKKFDTNRKQKQSSIAISDKSVVPHEQPISELKSHTLANEDGHSGLNEDDADNHDNDIQFQSIRDLKRSLPLDSKYVGRRRRTHQKPPHDIEPQKLNSELDQSNKLDGFSDAWTEAVNPKSTPSQKPSLSNASSSSQIDPGAALISQLKRQALAGAQMNLKKDVQLQKDVERALEYYPGIDDDKRKAELASNSDTVESLLASGKASVENFNLLMKSQSLQGRVDDAIETLKQMGSLGFPPDSESFVSLLQGCVVQKDAAKARLVYLRMRSLGIEPTIRVYSSLIKTHIADRDLKSAFSLLTKMEDAGLKADVVIYTALADGCVKARDYKKAWEVFREARTWKLIEPDEVFFTVMIKACAKQGQIEKAFNMLDDMRQSGCYPTSETYIELIRACATAHLAAEDHRGKYLNKAFEFFEQMKAEGMPIEHKVMTKLLDCCATAGDIKRAKEVVKQMRTSGALDDNHGQLSSYDHQTILRTLANNMRLPRMTDTERTANVRNAWLVIKSLQDSAVVLAEAKRDTGLTEEQKAEVRTQAVDAHVLNELMSVYASGGFAKHAVDMLDQFKSFNVAPNTKTFEVLLKLLGKDLNDPARFFALWDYMRTQVTVTTPSDLTAEKGDGSVMEANGEVRGAVKISPYLMHLALDVAIDSKSASKVLSVMNQMYENQVWPTVKLTERLSKVGRNIPEIHVMVVKLAQMDRTKALKDVTAQDKLVKAQIEEHALREAVDGRMPGAQTVESRSRQEFFKEKAKTQGKKQWLSKQDYASIRKKGGSKYAEKVDRPRAPPSSD